MGHKHLASSKTSLLYIYIYTLYYYNNYIYIYQNGWPKIDLSAAIVTCIYKTK